MAKFGGYNPFGENKKKQPAVQYMDSQPEIQLEKLVIRGGKIVKDDRGRP